jgi:Ca2+-binding RTX toxin-like protein
MDLKGTNGNDELMGTSRNDSLDGGTGNDWLDGGTGNDSMVGGADSDTYVVDSAGDVVTELTNEGTDTVQSSITYTLGANVENLTLTKTAAINGTGNTLNNVITGNSGNNSLSGAEGNDTLYGGAGNDSLDGGAGNDTLSGGAGNDTYVVDSIDDVVTESSGVGYDFVKSSVNYTLGDNVEKLQLIGSATVGTGNALDNEMIGSGGRDSLDGGDGNDSINGYLGSDTLYGGAGNDTLDGGQNNGGDTLEQLYGGLGDDTYVVENVTDRAIEDADQGTDTVESSITFTLTDNLENLTLTGTVAINGTGNALNNVITGNDGDNTLDGGDGNDLLNGGLGPDSLFGGTGNDTLDGGDGNDSLDGGAGNDALSGGGGDDIYVVDSTDDVVTEMGGGGTDNVKSSTSYTLGDNVERLTLTGSAANGTGNTLNNTIYGTDVNNSLWGGDGNDTLYGYYGSDKLYGGTGNDVLHGGQGKDTLTGGAGNDGYLIDSIDDVIVELDGEGTDWVAASYDYTLLSNFENLQLSWYTIKGTGNALNNVIYGNLDNNVLDGGAGDDTLYGGKGNDTYVVDSVGDIVDDYMDLGAPNNGQSGTDIVLSSVTFTLSQYIENLTLTGSANLNGTGNALNNVITGNTGNNSLSGAGGNDTLYGGAGNDRMVGGYGNDSYEVDSINDAVVEVDGEGTDLVHSSITYTLDANVENLTLMGSGAINGTGNAAKNTILGNDGNNALYGNADNDTLLGRAGNDTLDGGEGDDELYGGGGDDTYVVDSSVDKLSEIDGDGTDTVQSSITFTLRDFFENLTLTGTSNLNGTGNAVNNAITGNDGDNDLSGYAGNDSLVGGAGNDRLDGGADADQMAGGVGDDTYVVDDTADSVSEDNDAGKDTVQSSIDYELRDNFENLVLTGSEALSGAGNALDNAITGNDANNVLSGGAGSDTLSGGKGDDTYIVTDALDTITEAASSDSQLHARPKS